MHHAGGGAVSVDALGDFGRRFCYAAEVIGGPGAFAISVDPKSGYGDAILRKLVLEVAWVDSGEKTF